MKASSLVWPLWLALILVSPILFSQVNPKLDWKMFNTPHFTFVFEARHFAQVKEFALRAEHSHFVLQNVFKSFPDKTLIIINDNTDLPNGYATQIPYPHMMLFPVLPGPLESIGEYGDWPFELLLHEYTHILTFQPVRGVTKVLRGVFGNILAPNILLPRWWHEGLAVDFETRFSQHGRLRSNQQQAAIRALTLDQAWAQYQIGEINEQNLKRFPQGGHPYFFGSLLLNEILSDSWVDSDRKNLPRGGDLAGRLVEDFGGRVPYAINAPIFERTGSDFTEHFANMKKRIQEKAKLQIAELKQFMPGFSQGELLEFSAMENTHPVISPDGRYLTLLSKNFKGEKQILLFDRKNKNTPFDAKTDWVRALLSSEDENLTGVPGDIKIPQGGGELAESYWHDAPPSGSISRLSWFANSKELLFDLVATYDDFYTFSDLYTYSLDTKKTKRLTLGLRAKEPSPSPDGRWVVFVKMDLSETSLGLLDVEENIYYKLYAPGFLHRLSSPVFVTEQDLLFIHRNERGEQNLLHLPLTKEVLQLSADEEELAKKRKNKKNLKARLDLKRSLKPKVFNLKALNQPVFLSKMGEQILVSAERHGVYNLFSFLWPASQAERPQASVKKNHLHQKAALKLKPNRMPANQEKVILRQATFSLTGVYTGTFDPRLKDSMGTMMTSRGLQVSRFKKIGDNSLGLVGSKEGPRPETLLYTETVDSADAFKADSLNSEQKDSILLNASMEPYTVWPYLWPNYWIPFFYATESGYGFSASSSGQDPLAFHTWSGFFGYDSFLQQSSGAFTYSHNSHPWRFGFLLSATQGTEALTALNYTSQTGALSGSKKYSLFKQDFYLSLSGSVRQAALSGDSPEQTQIVGASVTFDEIKRSSFLFTPYGGWGLRLQSQHSFKTEASPGFETTTLKSLSYLPNPFVDDHYFFFSISGRYNPYRLTSILDFTPSSQSALSQDSLDAAFSLRGYDPSFLIFKSGAALSFEYRMPLYDLFLSYGTLPFFLHNSHLNLVMDWFTIDGFYLNKEAKFYQYDEFKKVFSSYGVEIKADSTLGYLFPLRWVLGLYARPQYVKGGDVTTYFGLEIR